MKFRKGSIKFKEGDIVRCIDSSDNSDIKINTIYVIKFFDKEYSELNDFVDLTIYNFRDNEVASKGFYSWRFKKVSKKDLTEKERFQYIKYKLGCKGEI